MNEFMNEIEIKPYKLKIIDINNNYCPDCNYKLIKKETIREHTITCKKCSWRGCGCDNIRPFVNWSKCCCESCPYLVCDCEIKNIKVLNITCNNCRIPKCYECNVNIINNNYKPLYEHEYISITKNGYLICKCSGNRNTQTDDFQNLCSPCNYKLNKGDLNSKFICIGCYNKRESEKQIINDETDKIKQDFIKNNPDLSDSKNKYKLDETNPYNLKWIHEYTTNNCLKCSSNIECVTLNKSLYKFCFECNPSNSFIEYKWLHGNWYIRLVKILDNKKHKWVKPQNNIKYDENYVCKCEKCEKYINQIKSNKNKIFEKINIFVNDINLSNNIIDKLFDIKKSFDINIKNIKKDIKENFDGHISIISEVMPNGKETRHRKRYDVYNFNDKINDDIRNIVRFYMREHLNQYSDED